MNLALYVMRLYASKGCSITSMVCIFNPLALDLETMEPSSTVVGIHWNWMERLGLVLGSSHWTFCVWSVLYMQTELYTAMWSFSLHSSLGDFCWHNAGLHLVGTDWQPWLHAFSVQIGQLISEFNQSTYTCTPLFSLWWEQLSHSRQRLASRPSSQKEFYKIPITRHFFYVLLLHTFTKSSLGH